MQLDDTAMPSRVSDFVRLVNNLRDYERWQSWRFAALFFWVEYTIRFIPVIENENYTPNEVYSAGVSTSYNVNRCTCVKGSRGWGRAPVGHHMGLIVIVAKGTTNLVTVLHNFVVEFQYKYSLVEKSVVKSTKQNLFLLFDIMSFLDCIRNCHICAQRQDLYSFILELKWCWPLLWCHCGGR